jgi:hypothetical protein
MPAQEVSLKSTFWINETWKVPRRVLLFFWRGRESWSARTTQNSVADHVVSTIATRSDFWPSSHHAQNREIVFVRSFCFNHLCPFFIFIIIMIFPVAFYYLVELPLFHFGGGVEPGPLAFVVAFLAVFAASAVMEYRVIGNLDAAWFHVKMAFVAMAVPALLLSLATGAAVSQLEDVTVVVFVLESVWALVVAALAVHAEYQQVFVDDDDFSAIVAEYPTVPSPPAEVTTAIEHPAVIFTTPPTAATTTPTPSTPSVPSPPDPPFDAETYLRRVHMKYQLEAEAAVQRMRRLLPDAKVEKVTPATNPIVVVTSLPDDTLVAAASETDDAPPLAHVPLPQLVDDDAGHDTVDHSLTQLVEPSEDHLDLPFPTPPVDTPAPKARRSVRHVKAKREGTFPTPPATYTTRSGRSVRPPDRFMVGVPTTRVDVTCYTTRSGRCVQPPSRFTVEAVRSRRH